MGRVGLRAQLVAAFVGIAAIATLVAALLTSLGLHNRFDSYLQQRTTEAAGRAVASAETAYGADGRWTPVELDLLAHELVLTGYDFRLVSGGRVLLDTTTHNQRTTDFRQVASRPIRDPAGTTVGRLQLFALSPRGNLPADQELEAQLDRAHLLAALIAAAIAIVCGLVVAGRLSGPIRQLAAAARGLASGEGTVRAPAGSREVGELAQALSGLAADLDRQQRARRQLAQDLSHELRTPLMLLQSRIEAMQDRVLPFDDAGLAALHDEALHLGRLVGQIERLAEAEAHPTPMRRDRLNLDAVAADAGTSLIPDFSLRGMSLDMRLVPTAAVGDRDAALQVVRNLLGNALKYAPSGSDVRLETANERGRACLRVRDAGRTLAGDGERVFDRFYRGVDSRERDGMGLGLTIARNLARAQRGDLELEAGAEQTTFVFWLPAPS
jgi:two-component system sensor histidine kinase BaeS